MEKNSIDSDAAPCAPDFDGIVAIIEKNFVGYLRQSMAFTEVEIADAWQRYKALNHLYRDEKQYFPPLPEPILNDDDVKDLDAAGLEEEANAIYQKYCTEKGLVYHLMDAATFCLGYMAANEGTRKSAVSDDDEYPDLSTVPNELKHETITGFVELSAKHAMRLFYAFGLETHIECTVVNEPTNETFDFIFRKKSLDENESALAKDAVYPDELWDEFSEYIDDDIDSLTKWAGSTVITKERFKKVIEKLKLSK